MAAEEINVYECGICGSIWKGVKPLNGGTDKMINMLEKLKKPLKGE